MSKLHKLPEQPMPLSHMIMQEGIARTKRGILCVGFRPMDPTSLRYFERFQYPDGRVEWYELLGPDDDRHSNQEAQ